MTILTVQFARSPKRTYDYLLRNTTVRRSKMDGSKPVYVEKGTVLKFITGSHEYEAATVIGVTKTNTLPKHVTSYIQIDDSHLEVYGMYITPEIKKKIHENANKQVMNCPKPEITFTWNWFNNPFSEFKRFIQWKKAKKGGIRYGR